MNRAIFWMLVLCSSSFLILRTKSPFLSQWVAESTLRPGRPVSPWASIFQLWVPSSVGDASPCLYFELSYIFTFPVVLLQVVLLYVWDEKRCSASFQPRCFVEINLVFTENILIVNVMYSSMQNHFLKGENSSLFICVAICWTDELMTYVLIFLLPLSSVSKFCWLLIEILQHLVAATQTYETMVTFRVWWGLMKLCLNDGLKFRCRRQAFPVSVTRGSWK